MVLLPVSFLAELSNLGMQFFKRHTRASMGGGKGFGSASIGENIEIVDAAVGE